MRVKRKHLAVAGAAAAAGYLVYRSRKQAAPGVAGLGAWYNPVSWFSSTETEKAEKSQKEALALYNEFRAQVAAIPEQYRAINPSKARYFDEVLAGRYADFIAPGQKAMQEGRVTDAATYFGYAIPEFERALTDLADFMTGSAKAAEALASGSATPEEAKKISSSEIVRNLNEEYAQAAKDKASAESTAAAAGKVLEVAKPVGDIFGASADKGFFENVQSVITRLKWYALAGVGIYVAIKFGPGIMAWWQARQAGKAAGGIPPLAKLGETQPGRVEYVFSNPRRRRARRR